MKIQLQMQEEMGSLLSMVKNLSSSTTKSQKIIMELW